MAQLLEEEMSEVQESPDETEPLISDTPDALPLQSTPSVHGRKTSVIVYILVIMFAVSSWIALNGMWVEMPLLVNSLPEGWSLPSYLTVIIQIANIGPLLYIITTMATPCHMHASQVVYLIIVIGAVACILLSFLWDRVSLVGHGKPHSVALFGLTAFLALVDCMSSVVFLPYMAQFKPQYMTAFYVGEGLSGFIPGLVGLMQGLISHTNCTNATLIANHTGESGNYPLLHETPPSFGVGAFFLFLFSMICVSGIAFTLLNHTAFCRMEHLRPSYYVEEQSYTSADVNEPCQSCGDLSTERIVSEPCAIIPQGSDTAPAEQQCSSKHQLSHLQYVSVLILTAWINALQNGILPSTQSYSCLPYGSLAYTLAVRLSAVANPSLCFLALFIPTRSLRVVCFLTMISTALAGYQLLLAALSPNPPLKDQPLGVTLVVGSAVMLTSCFSYVKVMNASILCDHGGSKALLWCGSATQIGSSLGAVAMFIVIDTLHLLHTGQTC